MNSSNKLNLDLTFTGYPSDLSEGLARHLSAKLLTESQPWVQEITNWIQLVQKNLDLTCHPVVRRTNSISMGLQLTDDSTIAQLNMKWRKKPQITDVLSFPAIEKTLIVPLEKSVELGDIVVSVQTAERQASEYNHKLDWELKWLVSHGLLHLLGWEHSSKVSLGKMLSLQEQLLSSNGKV